MDRKHKDSGQLGRPDEHIKPAGEESFKGSPPSVPSEAPESGDPLLTGESQGRPLDKDGKPIDIPHTAREPKGGEHWESGRHQAQ